MTKRLPLLATMLLSLTLGLSRAPGLRAAEAPATAPAGGEVALPLELPKPAYKETPKNVGPGLRMEPPRSGPRPPFLVPKGVVNLARGKPVTASDSDPVVGTLSLVTDGDKEATEGSYVELGRGVQWVQIDLGGPCPISAVVVWHYHGQARVYHDVIVQVSDDPQFKQGVTTLFNNDDRNEAGQGAGKDLSYFESFEGKIIDGKGVRGRYVRLYSNGNTTDDENHYTEVEVWGNRE